MILTEVQTIIGIFISSFLLCLAWSAYPSLQGITHAVLYSRKGTFAITKENKIFGFSDEHRLFTAERLCVGVIGILSAALLGLMVLYNYDPRTGTIFMYNLAGQLLVLLAFYATYASMSFSFWHNGLYAMAISRIVESVTNYKFNTSNMKRTVSETEIISMSWHTRLAFFVFANSLYIALIYFMFFD